MNKTDLVWLLFKSLKKLSFTHPLNHRCDRIVGPFTEHIADGMVHEHPITFRNHNQADWCSGSRRRWVCTSIYHLLFQDMTNLLDYDKLKHLLVVTYN